MPWDEDSAPQHPGPAAQLDSHGVRRQTARSPLHGRRTIAQPMTVKVHTFAAAPETRLRHTRRPKRRLMELEEHAKGTAARGGVRAARPELSTSTRTAPASHQAEPHASANWGSASLYRVCVLGVKPTQPRSIHAMRLPHPPTTKGSACMRVWRFRASPARCCSRSSKLCLPNGVSNEEMLWPGDSS